MTVRYLDQTLINQIAAGEVIERPASAIKELIENAIDAGATKIDIHLKEGGKTYISVTDNGKGMDPKDLELCVERHATSKIPDGDLFNIRTLGFRGEALPSIGSVSRLILTSRLHGNPDAWQIKVEGGQKHPLAPTSASPGTRVEIRDLFFATPARLKFLKSSTSEVNQITDILYRQALVNPHISFTLKNEEKALCTFPENADRLPTILGKDFSQNALNIHFERGNTLLTGWSSIPSYSKSSSSSQYLFVNGRPVKDKLFSTALKVAYMDVLSGNRHPAAVLFLTCDPEDVDINVHPAKAEVRFRDPNLMRGFIIAAIREALTAMPTQSATTIADKTIASFSPEHLPQLPQFSQNSPSPKGTFFPQSSRSAPSSSLPLPHRTQYAPLNDIAPSIYLQRDVKDTIAKFNEPNPPQNEHHPLGYAKAQLHDTYIVAETNSELILVDQHAAHERLVYESIKKDLHNGLFKKQSLLIPTVIELSPLDLNTLKDYLPELSQYGFTLETFGENSLIIREIPTVLQKCNIKQLFLDLCNEISDRGTETTIEKKLHERLADKACRYSIRAGKKLSIEEMNALLREIESTPFSSQCNHGRPTYIKLSKNDLEKLFERA